MFKMHVDPPSEMQDNLTSSWQIIGAGAIGCLWAANLIKAGHKIHLISRHSHKQQSISYQDLLGKQEVFTCSHSNKLANSVDPILVCVKAPQVKQALFQHRKQINNNQVIILMHNGMGSAEQVTQLFPNNPIICATTANACLLLSPLNIKQTGLGITYLGAFNQQAKEYFYLGKQFNNALDNCHWSDDIEQKLWLKLIINIAINPLTAIHQVQNGELAKSIFQKQINEMINEIIPILSAIGISSNNSSDNNQFEKSNLKTTVNSVINLTADNYSSMNRDIFFKRATENEYINGYLLKKASQHHIATPLIESLYQQIKALENRSLAQINTEKSSY